MFIFLSLNVESLALETELNETKVPQSSKYSRVSAWESVGVGMGAGAIEAAVCGHPLWVMKTLRQCGIKLTLNDPWLLYERAFRGLGTTVFITSAIVTTRIAIRDAITRDIIKQDQSDIFPNLVSAFAGGSASALFACPLELVLTQQQLAKEKLTVRQTLQEIYRVRGLPVLLCGISPIMLRDGIVGLGFLALAPFFNSIINNNDGDIKKQNDSIVSGLAAGITVATISHPLDTLKTIMQSKALENRLPSYSKISRELWIKDGLKGFYRGFLWRGARVTLATWILYDATEWLTTLFVK